MKKILTLFLSLILMATQAQNNASDRIETNKGPLHIQPILHGSLAMKWNGKNILVDPYGGPELYKSVNKPDLILLTDIHPDHLDKKTLAGINTSQAVIVAPQAVAEQLPAELKNQVVVLRNGDMSSQFDITIKAIPMYNLPEAADAMHTKGRGNGYLLSIGGKNIYISGDTEDIPEMRALENIDVAFVSMNLPYTMDIEQAASAVLEFQPKVIYPYHYRGKDGLSDVAAFKQKVNAGNDKIEVRLRKWYPEKK
ncbi:MBL fold metallo-hydrolase [Rufibacter roseus]|uniref:MBL fold metallo-hydrolase n=1 Tax=Rufibacter roseus TaxID=1567108 RepID=A0ABW2DKL2_9BACT|nr:MBL fold metallo-hydrolase [Rufibacter roseus]